MSFKRLAGQSPEGRRPLRGRCLTRLSPEPRVREKTCPFHVRINSFHPFDFFHTRGAAALGQSARGLSPWWRWPKLAPAVVSGRPAALPVTSRSLDTFGQPRFCSVWECVLTHVRRARGVRDDDGGREGGPSDASERRPPGATTRSHTDTHGPPRGAASGPPRPWAWSPRAWNSIQARNVPFLQNT